MAYDSDKKPAGLTAITSLATDDTIIVGDTSDVNEVVKTITKSKFVTDIGSNFAAALGADDNYVTNAEKVVIGNTSGTNTGDQDLSGLTSNTDTDVSANSWVLDEDNMASDDATKVPTQQSVKAYVDANGGSGHDPVTVTDSAEIDFTLTGQNLTATLKAGSIDETKLDTSVNASLDLADSATQPGDLGALAPLDTVDTAQIDDEAVTLAKMAHVSTNRILGRDTAGTGDVEALTAAQAADIIGVGTGDSPQFAGVNVGHATDTTITRVSAGVIAVEGDNVLMEGNVDDTPVNGATTAPVSSNWAFDHETETMGVVSLGNLGSTEAIDWSAGAYFHGTLDANVTITFTNEVEGLPKTIILTYDGTAQRTLTFSDVDEWANGVAPTAPTSTTKETIVTVVKVNGTVYGFHNTVVASGGTITSGTGAPSSTPTTIGQKYLDTDNNREYTAYDTTSSADWRYVSTVANPD